MIRKLTAAFLALMLVVSLTPVSVLAEGDTTPPELIDVFVDKTEYLSGEKINVTIRAIDQSGVTAKCGDDYSFVYIINERTSEQKHFFLQLSETQGMLVASIDIDNNFRTDDYRIDRVDLVDNCYNRITIRQFPCSTPEFHIENTARTDFDGPVLTSLTVNKAETNVGDMITFNATADDPSGIRMIMLKIYGTQGANFCYYVYLYPVQGSQDSLYGTLTITSSMPDSEYHVGVATVADSLNNYTYYNNGFSNEETHLLPPEMKCIFKVNNPDCPVVIQKPAMTNVKLSKNSIKAGENLRIEATFDTKGNVLSQSHGMVVYLYRTSDHGGQIALCLYKTADNMFSIDWPVSAYLQPGDYRIERYDAYYNENDYVQYFYNPSQPDNPLDNFFPVIHISSVFSGTENLSIPLNGSFDKLAGVTASNDVQGDMTETIEAIGDVNTNQVGMYLVKYKIKSTQKDGLGNNYYYYDFRWVGVTELQTIDAIGYNPNFLVITNANVYIGTNNNDVCLEKDGSSIANSDSLSAPGNYTAFLKNDSSKAAKFIIDKTGPVITSTWHGDYPGTLVVRASCTGRAALAETRWIKNSVGLEMIRDSGQKFNSVFSVSEYGDYTLYALDKLGNESIKVITLQKISVQSVSVNLTSVNLVSGKALQIKASVAPSDATFKKVNWYSTNARVATVDSNGLIKAIAPGIAKITASACDGDKKAICTVNVTAPVEVKYIILSQTNKTVNIGSNFRLTASVQPQDAAIKTITWSSSNQKIITVSSTGYVKAVGVGTAYICAKAKNGVIAKCKVIVKLIGTSLSLSAYLNPSSAAYRVIT